MEERNSCSGISFFTLGSIFETSSSPYFVLLPEQDYVDSPSRKSNLQPYRLQSPYLPEV